MTESYDTSQRAANDILAGFCVRPVSAGGLHLLLIHLRQNMAGGKVGKVSKKD